MNSIYNYKDQLNHSGHFPFSFQLPQSWHSWVKKEDYDSLYKDIESQLRYFGSLWTEVNSIIQSIYDRDQKWGFEWMLALRAGPQDEEQEGIWHDDSSRDLALSLSLNLDHHNICGGHLQLRPFADRDQVTSIPPRAWGDGHIFATGKWGWEHKTTRVTHGNRLVLVVWITLLGQ
jgi:hypothetical protein